jgi:hypothetical protein
MIFPDLPSPRRGIKPKQPAVKASAGAKASRFRDQTLSGAVEN